MCYVLFFFKMIAKGNNIMAHGRSLVHIITNEVNIPRVRVEVY